MTRIRRFLAEAVSELGKVSWPTIEQTRQLTVLVFDQIFQRIIGVLQGALG